VTDRRVDEDRTGRVPPHSLSAEESLLGATLLSPAAIVAALDCCQAEDFYKPAHAHVFAAIAALHFRGEPADPVTVAEELRRAGLLDAVGGPATLVSLQAGTPATSNAASYARIVAREARRRRLLEAAAALERLGYGSSADEAELADEARTIVEEATGGARRADSALVFLTAAQLAAKVDARPPIGYLARDVFPADAHAVLTAAHKVGKTWFEEDLAVATAAGRAWLGAYQVDRPGRVLVFLGEGGERKMLRRLRAVCEFHGVRFEDLPIDLCFRVPHLSDAAHQAIIAAKLAANPDTVLVILDPLYLAARGAKGSDLYAMGEHLEALQHLTQAAGAALLVVHHFNQTGNGKGSERMSGAGPAEWGRVLASATVRTKSTDKATGLTDAVLEVQFVGDEIPDTELLVRRRVWADDPGDLASPLHYTSEPLDWSAEGDDSTDGLGDVKPAVRRVAHVLAAANGPLDVTAIGDRLADDPTGPPLKRRTIQDALVRLHRLGRAQSDHESSPPTWSASAPGAPEDGSAL